MVGSKVMAILTRYLSPADHTSSSPNSDCIKTQRQTTSETRAKIRVPSNGRIESYNHFDPLLKSDRPDLVITK